MGEAKVILSEVDNSNYVSSDGQVYAGICLYTPKGDATKPTLVTTINQLYSRYIGAQKFPQGCDIGLYSARKFLELGSNLWVKRVCTSYDTIGAALIPYNVTGDDSFTEYPSSESEFFHSAEDVADAISDEVQGVAFHTLNPGEWGKEISIDIVRPVEPTGMVDFTYAEGTPYTVAVEKTSNTLWGDSDYNYVLSEGENPSGTLEKADVFPVSVTAYAKVIDDVDDDADNPKYRVTVCKVKNEKGEEYVASVSDCFLKKVEHTPATTADDGDAPAKTYCYYKLYLDKDLKTEILPNAAGDKIVISARTEDYTSLAKGRAYILTVKDGNGNILERHIASNSPSDVDGFGTSIYIENVLKNSANIGVVMPSSKDAVFNITARGVKFNKARGGVMTIESSAGLEAARIASAKMFMDKDSYPMTVLLDGGEDSEAFKKTLIEIAETRRDSMAFLSTRSEDEKSVDPLSAVIDFRKSILNANSSYGALFGPHIKIYDEDTSSYVEMAPDGFMAGLVSRSKETGEIWFPIAGLNRGVLDSALDVSVRFTDAERDMLVDNQINPIRFYPGQGIVVWGNETLRSVASATQSLHVRLLLITIEPEMAKALEGLLFEMNDDLTRDTARTILDTYLDDIVARRGIDNKRVVCDTKTNNMPVDIDNNRMIVDVFVTPTGYVKTIKLNVTIQSHSISITDEE